MYNVTNYLNISLFSCLLSHSIHCYRPHTQQNMKQSWYLCWLKGWFIEVWDVEQLSQIPTSPSFLNVYLFIWEREREHARERGKGKERQRESADPKQALCWQQRAQRGAQSHELQDRDPSQSQTLNQLSHPGAPNVPILKMKIHWAPGWLSWLNIWQLI